MAYTWNVLEFTNGSDRDDIIEEIGHRGMDSVLGLHVAIMTISGCFATGTPYPSKPSDAGY